MSPSSPAARPARRWHLPAGEFGWLIAVGVVAGLCLAFAYIAGAVTKGDTGSFDRRVLLLFRVPGDPVQTIGPPRLTETMRDLTSLGSTAILGIILASVLVFLLLVRKYGEMLLVLASVGGGQVTVALLKMGFERPRPNLVPNAPQVFTASFPSAHATLSAVTYLTLGALLMRLQPQHRLKVFFLALSVFLTVLVGTSRIFLGVHWPTDVMAGWCLGVAWAVLCWGAALWLQRRGKVEHLDGKQGS